MTRKSKPPHGGLARWLRATDDDSHTMENNMSNIKKQIESVTKLHGGEREQVAKYRSFVAWQLKQRAENDGREPSPILKSE